MRKIYVTVTVDLIIRADEGVDVDDILAEMDILSQTDGADIEDHKVTDHVFCGRFVKVDVDQSGEIAGQVTDSK